MPGRERAVDDPRRGATGAPSTTTSRSSDRGGRLADLAMAGVVRRRRARASRRGPRSAGGRAAPASSSRAARTTPGEALYASSTIDDAAGADHRRAVRRPRRRGEPGDDLVERRGPRRARRRRRRARCGPRAARAPAISTSGRRRGSRGGTSCRRSRARRRRPRGRRRRPRSRRSSRGRACARPSARTRGSSALRIATPPSPAAGSASTSSAFASSIASIDPIRDRWTGWTAVTIPIDGRPIAASSRISPPTYIPISRTAASCSGPSRSTVSGRPTSLFWLPSVRSVANRRSRTPATASLVEVLAMLPVIPTTSGENRRAPGGGDRMQRRGACPATRTTVTSPSASSGASPASASGSRRTSIAGGARRGRLRRGTGGRRSARRRARRTGCRARRAGSRRLRRGSARSLRRRRVPPVTAAISSAVEPGGGTATSRTAECRIGRGHGLTPASARDATRPRGSRNGVADRVVRDPPEQLERHHRHLEVARGG